MHSPSCVYVNVRSRTVERSSPRARLRAHRRLVHLAQKSLAGTLSEASRFAHVRAYASSTRGSRCSRGRWPAARGAGRILDVSPLGAPSFANVGQRAGARLRGARSPISSPRARSRRAGGRVESCGDDARAHHACGRHRVLCARSPIVRLWLVVRASARVRSGSGKDYILRTSLSVYATRTYSVSMVRLGHGM